MGCAQSSSSTTAKEAPTSSIHDREVKQPLVAVQLQRLKNHKAQNLTHDFFNRDINTVYEFVDGQELGEGAFAVVRLAKHRRNGGRYAVKVFKVNGRLSPAEQGLLRQEVEIMRQLDHPGIIRLQEVYTEESKLYLVMDLAEGGDLERRLRDNRTLFKEETNAAAVIRKVTSAIGYCHNQGVVHRDLKLENLLFESAAIDSEVKLTDFGLSILAEQRANGAPGTADYMAPEQVSGRACMASDCWAIGVIAYVLLSGHFPFYAATDDGVKLKIRFSKPSISRQDFGHVSAEGRDFLTRMLVKDPDKRMTAAQRGGSNCLMRMLVKDPDKRMTAAQMDTDGSGLIGMADFKAALVRSGLQSTEAEAIFHSIDADDNGLIIYNEFLASAMDVEVDEVMLMLKDACYVRAVLTAVCIRSTLCCTRTTPSQITYNEFLASAMDMSSLSEETIRCAFEKLDCDQSGVITVANLKLVVGVDMTEDQLKETIAEIDRDGDGRIDFKEFRSAMRRSASVFAGTGGNMAQMHANGSSERSATIDETAPFPGLLSADERLSKTSVVNLAQLSLLCQPDAADHRAAAAAAAADGDSAPFSDVVCEENMF
ncbi:kinase-like domain-containing protein [Tribonema minus]|uniref:Kinase-like domain-containing protein n=1 Tax=Tribonema minus TaxID=303371 RepID=A0A835YW28_9STRA|nr:kinase-like domain-containing protein [Tribonema minus]